MTQTTIQGGAGPSGVTTGEASLSWRDTVRELMRPQRAVLMGLLTLGFVGYFVDWFTRQGALSINEMQDWGHAFAVPAVSLYLLYRERDRLVQTRAETFWPGVLPFLLGLLVYFYSVVAIRNHMIQGFSLVLTLFGLVLLLAGPKVTRVAFLSIAFLGFGITVSRQIMTEITFKLQEVAADGSWVILSLLGPIFDFTVDIAGNTLTIFTGSGDELPLNVAEACSGMRMVIAFLAMSGAVALISCRFWWQRTALILLGVPVALLMNMVRVAVLGLAMLIDPDLGAGDAHMLIGTVLLIPSLALFLGVVWSLNRVVTDPDAERAKQLRDEQHKQVKRRDRGGPAESPAKGSAGGSAGGSATPPGGVRRRTRTRTDEPGGGTDPGGTDA